MPLLERISRDPSRTTLSWQYSLSTTNAMYESLDLCHCCLFPSLVEYYFPREEEEEEEEEEEGFFKADAVNGGGGGFIDCL